MAKLKQQPNEQAPASKEKLGFWQIFLAVIIFPFKLIVKLVWGLIKWIIKLIIKMPLKLLMWGITLVVVMAIVFWLIF